MSRSKRFDSGHGSWPSLDIGPLVFSLVVLTLWVGHARADSITIVSPSTDALVAQKVAVTVTGKPDNAKRLRFYADGDQFAAAPAGQRVTRKWNARKASKGSHVLRVTAFDKTGAALATVQESVFVGTGIVISSPLNNAVVSEPLSVACQIATSVQSVNLMVDGVQKASGPPCSFSFPAGAIANGSHVIAAEAFGSGGAALGTDSLQVKVQSTPTPPTASPTGTPQATPSPGLNPTPQPGGSVTPASSPTPSASASAGQTPSPTPTPAPGAKAYYVDPSGNDSKSGTSPGSAWQTVARVNSANLRAGDVVYFKAGGEWRETLIPNASGSRGAPIVFTAYGNGSLPILCGSDSVTG